MEDAHAEPATALLIGGTSEIGLAILHRLVAGRLRQVVLAVRDPQGDRAGAAVDLLRGEGVEDVHVLEFEAREPEHHTSLVAEATRLIGDLDLVIVAHGDLGDNEALMRDPVATATIVDVNFAGAASVTLAAANRLVEQGHGTVLVIGSVAGLRPRAANFVYGSTKAGLDAFARGLGDALEDTGVRVVVLRPGFVRTRMTEGMDEQPFTADPDEIAEVVVDGLLRGRRVIWAPRPLQAVFGVLTHAPGPIWRRLSKR